MFSRSFVRAAQRHAPRDTPTLFFPSSTAARQYRTSQLWSLRAKRRPRARASTTQQTRHASVWTTWKIMWRQSMRTHPRSTPIVAACTAALAVFGITLIGLRRRADHIKFGPYPADVGQQLRRGVFFTDIRPDAERANASFFQALLLARQAGMDRHGDPVVGISTEWGRCMDKHGFPHQAVNILQSTLDNLRQWIAEFEAGEHRDVQDGKELPAAKRSRLLKRACEISTRLGELYASDYVGDARRSEQCLVWAVETALKERKSLELAGGPDAAADWMDDDQHGSQLEALGHSYERADQHFLAGQLFLQALMVKPQKDCHAVVLMNNVAASLAQQRVPTQPGTPPPSRAELRESARAWARRALELAAAIAPPERNAECDLGCVVATHNLGEFAEMDGDVAEARQRYEEAGSIAHAIGYEQGVVSAEEGLRRIDGRKGRMEAKMKNNKIKGWW